MGVDFARPDVANLVFHLFGRSVHPELFTVFARADVRHQGYSAVIRICDAGHAVTFHHAGHVLSEVTTARESPLPQRKRMLAHRLRGHRSETVHYDGGIQYHVSFQLEQLEPEVFLHFHEELLSDSSRSRLSHQFATKNRLSPAPMSFIQTEDSSSSLLIHSFHTFPDNYAVVKIQSLFEI